jgi:hypothetical protein
MSRKEIEMRESSFHFSRIFAINDPCLISNRNAILNGVLAKDPDYPDALFLKAKVLWEGFKRGVRERRTHSPGSQEL